MGMRSRPWAAALAACALWLAGCSKDAEKTASRTVPDGDAERGKAAIAKFGCGKCHTIPGVADAQGQTGPALTGLAARPKLAGGLENTPRNVVSWIRDPKSFDRKTAMPRLGVSRQEALDIAAYLYSAK